MISHADLPSPSTQDYGSYSLKGIKLGQVTIKTPHNTSYDSNENKMSQIKNYKCQNSKQMESRVHLLTFVLPKRKQMQSSVSQIKFILSSRKFIHVKYILSSINVSKRISSWGSHIVWQKRSTESSNQHKNIPLKHCL